MKRLLVLFLFLQGAALIFAQNPEAFIQDMTGTVELKAGGSGDWVPAKTGDRLESATIISTGFKSTALLTVGNSTMMVRPLTRLSLEELLLDRDNVETINVGLQTGRVQVNVNPPAGSKTSYTIRSPMATASVRGTSFYLDPVNLRVIEGAVIFQPVTDSAVHRPVTVSAGQETLVDIDTGSAVNPLTASETNRSLPALAGRDAAPSAGNTSRPRNYQGALAAGTFVAEITLNDGQ